jgi:hypothetical protein
MNNNYPYPIDHARYIPSSTEEAQRSYDELLNHKNLQSLDSSTFLRGWFALHFLSIGPHPDNASEWDDIISPFLDEAWRRRQSDEIEDGQYYCSDSQHQGLRLQKDGNIRCHVEGKSDQITGYITAHYDPERGNIPDLTGNKNLAYIYESPKKAYRACRRLNLDSFHIYAGLPDRDIQQPGVTSSQKKDLLDKTVVIQNEDNFYLFRDGRTMGDDLQFACKFQLHADNVEQQLQQVKVEYGVDWKWLDYATLR